MADLKEDRIDFGKLERELFSAVEADASYWRENDAKLRAMDQRVESYDQFRDMVAAAHIKPLDKKDKIGQMKRKQPWNPFSASNSSSSSSSSSMLAPESSSTKVKALPKNGHEFTKEWHKLKKKASSSADHYSYLIELGGDNLAKIFRAEISFGLLGEIVSVLEEGSSCEDCGKVADILTGLPRSGRFGLSLDFLSKAEKGALADLVAKLERWTADPKTDADSEERDSIDENEVAKGDGNEGEDETMDGEGSAESGELERGQKVCCSSDVTKHSTEIDIAALKEIYKLEEK